MKQRERLASFISGGGTTMQEIVKACQSGEIPMDVACVISSTSTAGGIEKAHRLGIPDKDIIVIDPNEFKGNDKKIDQEGFGRRILKELKDRGVTVVTQNGWMPLTPELIIDAYPEMLFNQHPGPVPEFGGQGMYGRRVHAARLMFARATKRDPWTEAIAQRVHKNFDQGVVMKSAKVDIFPDDTVDDLQKRVLPVEHRVQIALLKDVAQGTIHAVPGREPLVQPGEEKTLFMAKWAAKLLYPHG